MKFGHWLRNRRRALGLTQEQLAARVPCAYETLRKLEAGRRQPSSDMAASLARALKAREAEVQALAEVARILEG